MEMWVLWEMLPNYLICIDVVANYKHLQNTSKNTVQRNETNKISKSLMYISLLVLASLFIWGTPVHNAKSWFDLKFFKFQPAEVYKIVLIIYMAVYYDENINKLEEKSILLKPLLFIIIGFLLIASQPDLGTASITMLLALLIFLQVKRVITGYR